MISDIFYILFFILSKESSVYFTLTAHLNHMSSAHMCPHVASDCCSRQHSLRFLVTCSMPCSELVAASGMTFSD